MLYQLKVEGELDQSWSEWLGGVQMVVERQADGSATTTLTVDMTDQLVLFGILDCISDLNISLISISKDGQEI